MTGFDDEALKAVQQSRFDPRKKTVKTCRPCLPTFIASDYKNDPTVVTIRKEI